MYSIYDFPEVYDVVLQRSPEIIAAEAASIERLLAEHGVTRGRVLELACGTCPHGILLAQHGFAVTGIDRSPAMLEAAARRAAAAGTVLQLVEGDIVDFALDVEPFDAALFMFETFPVITAYDDIVSHFRAVRRHMRPGGLYIIDLDPRKRGVGVSTEEWGRRTLPLANGSVEVWNEDFPGDWVEGTSHLVMHCRILLDGVTYETADEWRLRVYGPWDLRVLVQTMEGWALGGFYSWRDLSPDIADEQHYLMVLETHP